MRRSLDVVGLHHRCCRRRARVVQQQRRARRDGRRTRLPGTAAHEPHRCKALTGNKTKQNNYEFCEIKVFCERNQNKFEHYGTSVHP